MESGSCVLSSNDVNYGGLEAKGRRENCSKHVYSSIGSDFPPIILGYGEMIQGMVNSYAASMMKSPFKFESLIETLSSFSFLDSILEYFVGCTCHDLSNFLEILW